MAITAIANELEAPPARFATPHAISGGRVVAVLREADHASLADRRGGTPLLESFGKIFSTTVRE